MKYKHNKTLRPRGELLMREKYKFDEDSILELMRMPTEEFCEKLGITKLLVTYYITFKIM